MCTRTAASSQTCGGIVFRPTQLMTDLGYKVGYVYDHDAPDHYAGQSCLPDELVGKVFYAPGGFGFEKDIAKRLDWWQARRKPRS